MVISIQDLCNNCKIASSFISPNPNINIPDNDGIILLKEGGIETDGDILGGSFKDKNNNTYWGYYSLEDYRFYKELKSIAELIVEQKTYLIYSRYTYYQLVKEVFREEYFSYTYKDGTPVTRTKLTNEELNKLKNHNDFLFRYNQEKALEELFTIPWYKETCTIEYPYKLYICGNDDTSYSKFFSTKKDMYKFFNSIKNNKLTYKFFKKQMIFTN